MIVVKNVTKIFSAKKAVDNISFDAPSGIITGLIGSNGSGKSTTMRLIATLMKQDEGTIQVDDIDTLKNPVNARKKIGILLGGDISLYDRLTAKENIMYYAGLQNTNDSTARKRLDDLVDLLNMKEYINRRVAGFSRGMRQKVAFARSVIHSPDILLLDEPSTGLDINSIKDVQEFILYCKSMKKTILLSTHNAHEMQKLCDRLVFMENGKIIAEGERDKLLQKTGCIDTTDLFFYYKERNNNEEILDCIHKRVD